MTISFLLGLLELIPHIPELVLFALQSKQQLRASPERSLLSCSAPWYPDTGTSSGDNHLQLSSMLLPALLESFFLFLLLLLQGFL